MSTQKEQKLREYLRKYIKELLDEYAGINIFPANGHGMMGSVGDASFIGPDGKMQGNSKKPIYKTPKSSVHYKKRRFDQTDFYDEDSWETDQKKSYINDKSVPKTSIHNQYFDEQLGIPMSADGTIDGGPRSMDPIASKKTKKKKFADASKYGYPKEEKNGKYLTFDDLEKDKDAIKKGWEANEKIRKEIEKEEKKLNEESKWWDKSFEQLDKLTTVRLLNILKKARTAVLYRQSHTDEYNEDEINDIIRYYENIKLILSDRGHLPRKNEEKDYDTNIVPKTSIHYGERDKVPGEKQMEFNEDKYMSDADIEKSYDNFKINSFELTPGKSSGYIEIDFPNREGIVDNFIVYDTGKVAFENWYPDKVYFKLVEYIYKNIQDINLKNKIKSALLSKGYRIEENAMSAKESLLIKKVNDLKNTPTQGDWKSNLSKAVMNLTPEAQPKEQEIPVPKVEFGETPEFPYKNEQDGSMIYPIPGAGIATKKGEDWTFGDTPPLPATAMQGTSPVSELPSKGCMAFGEPADDSEIDIPCTQKPLIKKLMMFLKNEQKNLHEGVALKGLYEGKVIKLNTVFEGEHRRFKAFVKTNEGKILKVHFGPTLNEDCHK